MQPHALFHLGMYVHQLRHEARQDPKNEFRPVPLSMSSPESPPHSGVPHVVFAKDNNDNRFIVAPYGHYYSVA